MMEFLTKWIVSRRTALSIILPTAIGLFTGFAITFASSSHPPLVPGQQDSAPRDAPKTVKVGGYVFPPYVQEEAGKFTGFTLDLIEVMNGFQSKYRFEFVPTSPLRRYKDFTDGVYDMILFESVDWGWHELPVDVSKVYAQDCEVFIARTLPNRSQTFFDDLKGKTLLVYLGYHYPFAGYNADPEFLLRAFNARTTVSHEANIHSVIMGRADLAVVTGSYLEKYLSDHPSMIPCVMVSDRKEQMYNHTILVRKNSRPSVGEINELLKEMERAGYLAILLGKYGIDGASCSRGSSNGRQERAKSLSAPVKGSTIVKVGGYHFPPYVELAAGKVPTGLTLDLLDLMNAFQSDYHFVFEPTSPLTRYKDLAEGVFDVMFFERKDWGWQNSSVKASREFLKDCEVYVARTGHDRTQAYFDSLKRKSLLGYLGYHYPIAEFKTDPDLLFQRYNLRVTPSHEENVRAILEGGSDMAIVTRSYVIRYLRDHPALIPRLLVSDRMEQEYRHTLLVRADSELLMKQIVEILSTLEKAGYASVLWGKYDVTPLSENQ